MPYLADITCVHCNACHNICPKQAISFKNKNVVEKCLFVDESLCIQCGLCESVCPVINEMSFNGEKDIAFAVYHNDKSIRYRSSSGGFFPALAKYVLESDGYVCGAVFDEDFSVKHVVSNKDEIVKEMSGSKYVESNIAHSYTEIKQLLCQGKIVLFSGCPCQVAGLKNFLRKGYSNLITIDLICHGSPDASIWKSYLQILESKYHSKICNINFRCKKNGWHNSKIHVKFENGKSYSQSIYTDPYMRGFLSGITIREACFSCKFKNFISGSDFTIGDYWGAESVEKEIDDNLGLSAVITHTKKATGILNSLGTDLLFVKNTNIEDIIKYNQNIIKATERNKQKAFFLECCKNDGIEHAINKFLYEKNSIKLKRLIYSFLRYIYYRIAIIK